ncbi:pX [Duck adenovirus 4]|uniref:PX n=1 Tax=Duck adenovirus 4 TaxID=2726020 RepID=A0A6M3QJ22_9ADEN|nr:pX [Duck adenovirus 4]
MPSILLTGGKASRKKVRLPKLRTGRRRRSAPVALPSTATATASERAALQSLARRLQRGNFTAWRSADYRTGSPAAAEAVRAAAQTGGPATATDLSTGTTAHAVPMSGTGTRRRARTAARRSTSRRSKRQLKGGFLPMLIPLIAAAIGAIPGIAGTAVGIASLKEQQRQFDEQQKQFAKMYGRNQ